MESELLPCDVLYHILNFLECKDLCSIRLVNSEFNQMAQIDSLWKERCDQEDLVILKDAGYSWMYTFVNAQKWNWDSKRTSKHLTFSPNLLQCWRGSEGSNPSAKTVSPFSEGRQLFEITVTNPGYWLSVGVSSDSFQCDSGYYLGSGAFSNSIECAYYSDKYMSDILNMGSKINDCNPLQMNDVVNIYVDKESISFFRNGEATGTIKFEKSDLLRFDPHLDLNQGLLALKLFPTISIGSMAKVSVSFKYKKSELLSALPSKRIKLEK